MTTQNSAAEAIGHEITFIVLDERHCEAIEKLQNKVRGRLSPTEQHFSAPKILQQLRENVRYPNFAAGAVIGDTIVGVAFAVTSLDAVLADRIREHNVNRASIEKRAQASVTTFVVDPEYAGNGIGRRLLNFLRLNALDMGFRTVITRVADTNERGHLAFQQAGWEILGHGIGTDGNKRMFYELNVERSPVPRLKLAQPFFPKRAP